MAKRTLPKYFENDEIIRFFDSVEETTTAMGCFIALFCGLRIGEVISLKWSDINLETGTIKFKETKTIRNDVVDIPKEIIPILRKWRYLTEGQDYFIPYKSNKHQTRLSRLTEGFHRALKKANLIEPYKTLANGNVVNKLTFHSWRHTFGTLLYEKTGDILHVKKCIRHASIRTTEIYAQCKDPVRKQKLDEAFSTKAKIQQPAMSNVEKNVELDPLKQLQIKFVNNEISKEDYLEKLKLLQLDKPNYFG